MLRLDTPQSHHEYARLACAIADSASPGSLFLQAMHRQRLLGHMDLDTREMFDGVLTAASRQVRLGSRRGHRAAAGGCRLGCSQP